MSDLKFSHIERTDHVQEARPIRLSLPLGSGMVRREEINKAYECTLTPAVTLSGKGHLALVRMTCKGL